jgi:competence protein ComEA
MFIAARPLALIVTLVVLTPPATAAAAGEPVRSPLPPPASTPRVVEPARDAHRAAAVAATTKVNINTADVKVLMTLTGVSRKVAEKIVAYRDDRGSFKKPDEIRKVEGVGNGVWEKNRQRIVVK